VPQVFVDLLLQDVDEARLDQMKTRKQIDSFTRSIRLDKIYKFDVMVPLHHGGALLSWNED
jgi:hypothetical protein